MVTLLDFLAEIVTSAIRLFVIFLTDIALREPLAFVTWLVGALLVAVSIAIPAYLVLGAVVELLGGTMWSPGRGHERRV